MLEALLEKFQAALPGPLAPEVWALVRPALFYKTVPRHGVLLHPGQVCEAIYFVGTGALRHYLVQDDREINTQFALPNSFTADFASLTQQHPTAVTIEALQPTVLLGLRRADMLRLYDEAPAMQAIGRALLEQLVAAQQLRLEAFSRDSAAARYRFLRDQHPALLQAVPLYQLASYLGLSRETLSRVRRTLV